MQKITLQIGTVALLALLLLTAACRTTSVITEAPDGTLTTNVTTTVDIDRIARLSGETAELGTVAWLALHPEHTPYFSSSIALLTGLLVQENYEPSAFAAALEMLPLQELKSPEAKVAFAAGRILFREALHEIGTRIEGQELVQKTLLAVRDGMIAGMGTAAPDLQRPSGS